MPARWLRVPRARVRSRLLHGDNQRDGEGPMGNLASALQQYPVLPRWWQCLICGTVNAPVEAASSEGFECASCGCTWRDRVVAAVVLLELRVGLFPLSVLTPDYSRVGVGIADAQCVAGALGARFDYVNGHLHRYPRLDLLNIPDDLVNCAEFVTCSEVLEHVEPPADQALAGLAALLRPDGFVLVTVPRGGMRDPGEYYPDLRAWEISDGGRVTWTDGLGVTRVDDDPEWHGGAGLTLAFRRWTEDALDGALREAGLEPQEPSTLGAAFRDDLGTPPLPDKIIRVARAPGGCS